MELHLNGLKGILCHFYNVKLSLGGCETLGVFFLRKKNPIQIVDQLEYYKSIFCQIIWKRFQKNVQCHCIYFHA